jgi:hypothetical protein
MIEIKQAVKAATEHLIKLYDTPPGVQLEEIYRSDDDGFWLVTLSFVGPVAAEELSYVQKLGYPFGMPNVARRYKTFEVDGETGEVRSMKIRPVPSV